jgi:hypothetical protein
MSSYSTSVELPDVQTKRVLPQGVGDDKGLQQLVLGQLGLEERFSLPARDLARRNLRLVA